MDYKTFQATGERPPAPSWVRGAPRRIWRRALLLLDDEPVLVEGRDPHHPGYAAGRALAEDDPLPTLELPPAAGGLGPIRGADARLGERAVGPQLERDATPRWRQLDLGRAKYHLS